MANLIKSPYPDIPIPKIHIYDLLFSSAKSAYSSPFCPETDAESVGRDVAWWETREVLIDSVNGVTYKFNELKQRIEELARALRNEGGDSGVPWKLAKDQVVGLFSTNHVDFPVTVWATIRASLIMTAANPAYLVDELIHQLTDSATKVLVTSLVNLPMALEVASKIGMPARNIVLLDSRTEEERKAPGIDRTEFSHNGVKHLTIQGLVEIGRTMAPLPKLSYGPEIVDQTAYLMYSSGLVLLNSFLEHNI
jgi:acyl-CoA synthetase (AMP-forming)/AMP-acid ligase II